MRITASAAIQRNHRRSSARRSSRSRSTTRSRRSSECRAAASRPCQRRKRRVAAVVAVAGRVVRRMRRRRQPVRPWPPRRRARRRRRLPDTVFIDELTWEENRDAMTAGKTVFIVPIGGTEKNGYHMVLGKHNYTVTHAANVMARKLEERARRADAAVRARRRSGSPELRRDLAAIAGLRRRARRHSPQLEGAWRHRHPVHRRQRRQPERHDRRGHQAQRGMEGRRHARLRADVVLRRRPRPLSRVDGSGVRVWRRHHRQPRRHQRYLADAARAAGGHSQEPR